MTIEWKAPAGGLWELETTHVRGGQPRVFQERATPAFRDPFMVTAARYGLPISCIEVRFVNDHCYARSRPVGARNRSPASPARHIRGSSCGRWSACTPSFAGAPRRHGEPTTSDCGARTCASGSPPWAASLGTTSEPGGNWTRRTAQRAIGPAICSRDTIHVRLAA